MRTKGRNDNMTTGLDRSANGGNVSLARQVITQKVKPPPIVPKVVASDIQLRVRNISTDPANPGRTFCEPCASRVQSRLRQIQNGEIVVPALQQIVYKRRGASPDIYYCRIVPEIGGLQECNRTFKVWPEPTDLFRAFTGVNLVPVFFAAHLLLWIWRGLIVEKLDAARRHFVKLNEGAPSSLMLHLSPRSRAAVSEPGAIATGSARKFRFMGWLSLVSPIYLALLPQSAHPSAPLISQTAFALLSEMHLGPDRVAL